MLDTDQLQCVIHFLETADRLKSVYRAAYLGDHSRNESSAEHTWHVCLFALLLAPEVDSGLDAGHVIELLLVHDLVEIEAGDTWVHNAEDRALAREREERAADALYALLPSELGQRLQRWWREFEDGVTPEARFARAMDRLHGFSQNLFAAGRVWRERGVSEAMTRAVNQEAMDLHPVMREVYEALYVRAASEGLFDGESHS